MPSTAPRNDTAPFMELNTTPLIDVMLVLLVMFIITMPPPSHKVAIDLPGRQPPTAEVHAGINRLGIDVADNILWNGAPVSLAMLQSRLDYMHRMAPNEPDLYIQPDPAARFDIADHVLAAVKRSQVSKVAFIGNEQYQHFVK